MIQIEFTELQIDQLRGILAMQQIQAHNNLAAATGEAREYLEQKTLLTSQLAALLSEEGEDLEDEPDYDDDDDEYDDDEDDDEDDEDEDDEDDED